MIAGIMSWKRFRRKLSYPNEGGIPTFAGRD
jgi:hypothetical protein